jgi:hypothetical protein
MTSDHEYHSRRARMERDIAYRAADERVSNAHMRLSALHLERALVSQEIDHSFGEELESAAAFRQDGVLIARQTEMPAVQ